MSSANLVRLAYKKESAYGVLNAAVKASKVIQDLTFTAVKGGQSGNNITIAYTTGGTAGSEVVTVNGNAISIQIQSGTSTASQIRTAFNLVAAAIALASCAVSGTGSNPQTSTGATNLISGLYDWNTARFTSEKYSGTPTTAESAQIRTDRMSSGQVVTGLQVDGGHNFELAKELALEDFMASAMYNTWSQFTQKTRALTISTAGSVPDTITAVSGSFINDGLVVGDIVVLTGFTAAGNNVPIQLTAVNDLTFTFIGPTGMLNGTGGTTKYQRADKLSIGITPQSLSVEKTFLDLTTKAILYKGVLCSQMDLTIQYGALVSGSFSTSANSYDTANAASEFMSYLEYIDSPATSATLNGSVDMPFLMSNESGSFLANAFAIQSVKMSLNNNLKALTQIGIVAPTNYSPGTAQLKIDMSAYLADANWELLARKLTQAPFALGFMVNNTDGWYGFYLPALQVSFADPASAGQNQIISLSMSGTAKVGANSESELSIFRLPT